MAYFQIKGLTAHGQLVQQAVEAASPEEAALRLRQQGLQVLEIRASLSGWQLRPPRRIDIALFAQELLALLRAGLSLIEALETLAERQQAGDGRSDLIPSLVRRMREGQSFSLALQGFPAEFPELFVASIAASEQTGEMVPALERYLRYHEQVSFIRQKLISASLYPALLLIVGMGVALFLLGFLVPRFSHIYEGMDAQLPLASRLLMQWGTFAGEHVVLLLILVVVLGVAAAAWYRSGRMLPALLGLLQRHRWLGEQLRLMQLSRFYRALGLLLRGGIPVLKALRMTQPLLPATQQAALAAAIAEVSQGRQLSESLQAQGLATAVALRLLRAGERNGQVADMLESVAAFHDKEVATWIDRFARLVEPMLMLLIGGVIGGIVILLYLPIFELAGSLQ